MDNGYKVAACDCVTEFTEKKSRFISYLACVNNVEDAQAFVEKIRKKHPDATHNCVAYRLFTPRVERFSDDGEPAGTAGMPMLEVMKKEDIFDVCVVVTRYFGGVLLGGGGLIRAYSRGVSDALAKSGSALRLGNCVLDMSFGYNGLSRVEKYLEKTTHNRILCDFLQDIRMQISVKCTECEKITADIVDLLGGRVKIEEISRGFDSFK